MLSKMWLIIVARWPKIVEIGYKIAIFPYMREKMVSKKMDLLGLHVKMAVKDGLVFCFQQYRFI